MRGTTAVPLARTLEELAALATIRGDAAEAMLLLRGAQLARERGVDTDAALGPLLESPDAIAGIEPQLLTQLRHMYEAGAWVLLESAIADLPADLRWLFESGAVTVPQLAALHSMLGTVSAADLADAVERQAVRTIAGLDASIEFAVASALPTLRSPIPRVPLGRATGIVEPIAERLRVHPGVTGVSPVGSLRRGMETVGDIELVAPAVDPRTAIDELVRLPGLVRVLHRSDRRLYLRMERAQVGVRFPSPDRAGALLLHLTGSPAHIAALRHLARERGDRLSADGLHREGAADPIAGTEEAIYGALGLPFIPPEIREGADEIDAARRGALPSLLAPADIRGDLHMHTTFSDGRDTVDAMVAASRALGYEYVAITDHSPQSAAARTLSLDGVRRQADEVAAAREKYPDIAVLHGCEVDILADGRLDFSDRVLERFDIVLASLHERAGQSPDQLLKRYISAVRHPLVHVITHPTNRLVPYRPGYDIDYDRLIETATAAGTILEIDGAPAHLDMDGALARRAAAAGAVIAVNSDCHRADMLRRHMQFGVTTARRGWVEARHVLNTRPLADVRRAIARKRAG